MRKISNMPDWMIRTIKTFIQAFGGTFIPSICIVLNQISTGGLPNNFGTWLATVLIPIICAALAAGIAAAWNIILEHLKEGGK